MIAANCGGDTTILIGERHHPDKIDFNHLPIKLEADGKVLHEADATATKDGQWQNLMTLINQIIAQGRIIHEGDLIISGAIGGADEAKTGRYQADYGELGKLGFTLR